MRCHKFQSDSPSTAIAVPLLPQEKALVSRNRKFNFHPVGEGLAPPVRNGFNLIFMLLSCTNKKVTKEIAEGVPSEPLRAPCFKA